MNWDRFSRGLQWLLAFVAALICIFTIAVFARAQAEMWPLPALYLLEIALVGLLAVACINVQETWSTWALWTITGILLAFVILGGFSIGPFLFPALLATLGQALLKARQLHTGIPIGLGVTLLAALLQAGIMFLAIALGA